VGVNTRIMPRDFNYLEPKTKKEALNRLKEYDNIKILAGGTDLIVKLKTGADSKVDYLMNIKEISALNYIRYENDQVLIGACTPLSTIERNELIIEKLPALCEAIQTMAAIAVRNMGTVGGNICNSSPAGDTIPPLTAYGAKLVLERIGGVKVIPISDFITGAGKNILGKDELLSEIVVPVPALQTGVAFIKKSRVKSDISKINTAVYIERDGDRVKGCKIVLGSVAATVIRIKKAEESLNGQRIDRASVSEAARIVSEEIKPIDDNRSTVEYRKAISRVIIADAIIAAWQRSGGVIDG